jgi:hypothetical protein
VTISQERAGSHQYRASAASSVRTDTDLRDRFERNSRGILDHDALVAGEPARLGWTIRIVCAVGNAAIIGIAIVRPAIGVSRDAAYRGIANSIVATTGQWPSTASILFQRREARIACRLCDAGHCDVSDHDA